MTGAVNLWHTFSSTHCNLSKYRFISRKRKAFMLICQKTRESWILTCNSPTISVFRLIRLPHISYRAFSTSLNYHMVNCLISLWDFNDVRHRFIREQGRESYQLEIMKENLYPGHVWILEPDRMSSNQRFPMSSKKSWLEVYSTPSWSCLQSIVFL